MASGKLRVTIEFYEAERNMYRAGTAAFDAMLEESTTYRLEAIGAIAPYRFETIKRDGRILPHVFAGEETS